MAKLQIVALAPEVELAQGRGDAVFTVTSSATRSRTYKLSVRCKDHPEAESWLKLKGLAERTLSAGTVEQVVVGIEPPAGSALGKYLFFLRATSVENPDEEWEDSQSVAFSIKEARPAAAPWKWIIPVALVASAVIGFVLWLVLFRPTDVDPKTDAGVVVDAAVLPPDPNAEAIRELWSSLPESPSADCNLDYDFQPPGPLSLYCRLIVRLRYEVFAARLSMPIYTNRAQHLPLVKGAESDFGRYDPRFVAWLLDHGVPAASDPVLRQVSQPVYDRWIRTSARLFYFAKRAVDESGRRETFLAAYRELLQNPRSDSARRNLRYFELVPPEMYEEPISRIYGIAMLFWMRRAIDGTELQFYEGIKKVLSTYDAPWLELAERTPPAALPPRVREWFYQR